MSLEMDGKLEDTNEKRATIECALDVTQLCANHSANTYATKVDHKVRGKSERK
jgi:hypothetical protein